MATTPRKTTTKKTTTRKTTTKASGTAAKTAAAKSTEAAVASVEKATPKPTVVNTSVAVVSTPELKKKELIEAVVTRSGIKKKDAKPVVEAMLAILGEELGEGRELNLQPLGKMKINRIKQLANGRIVMCKLRRSNAVDTAPKTPLQTPPSESKSAAPGD